MNMSFGICEWSLSRLQMFRFGYPLIVYMSFFYKDSEIEIRKWREPWSFLWIEI